MEGSPWNNAAPYMYAVHSLHLNLFVRLANRLGVHCTIYSSRSVAHARLYAHANASLPYTKAASEDCILCLVCSLFVSPSSIFRAFISATGLSVLLHFLSESDGVLLVWVVKGKRRILNSRKMMRCGLSADL